MISDEERDRIAAREGTELDEAADEATQAGRRRAGRDRRGLMLLVGIALAGTALAVVLLALE